MTIIVRQTLVENRLEVTENYLNRQTKCVFEHTGIQLLRFCQLEKVQFSVKIAAQRTFHKSLLAACSIASFTCVVFGRKFEIVIFFLFQNLVDNVRE